jgi:hypothetical protein
MHMLASVYVTTDATKHSVPAYSACWHSLSRLSTDSLLLVVLLRVAAP